MRNIIITIMAKLIASVSIFYTHIYYAMSANHPESIILFIVFIASIYYLYLSIEDAATLTAKTSAKKTHTQT